MITTSSWQGLETLLIDTGLARCEIALYGAQVLSFVPRADGRDLLWCSPARLAPGRPVRGGVPGCWPWCAKQDRPADAAQHGFVRRMTWRVATCAERADGQVRVLLQLAAAHPDKVAELAKTLTPSHWQAARASVTAAA